MTSRQVRRAVERRNEKDSRDGAAQLKGYRPKRTRGKTYPYAGKKRSGTTQSEAELSK